jgi:hypothetical protein
VLAKKLDVELINRAVSGCSNFFQLDTFYEDSVNIKPADIVVFAFSTPWRDRFQLPISYSNILEPVKGPWLGNFKLFEENHRRTAIADFFYTLSVIEKLEDLYNLRIIKFNAFHNVFEDATEDDLKKFQFKNFIGLHTPGNTLLDVLTDNWGNPVPRISDHSKWKPTKNSHLFTRNSHPNEEGHKVIANWLQNENRTSWTLE